MERRPCWEGKASDGLENIWGSAANYVFCRNDTWAGLRNQATIGESIWETWKEIARIPHHLFPWLRFLLHCWSPWFPSHVPLILLERIRAWPDVPRPPIRVQVPQIIRLVHAHAVHPWAQWRESHDWSKILPQVGLGVDDPASREETPTHSSPS